MRSESGLGREDLVFYSSTIFERSLTDKLTAAECGGFAGVGLWASDLKIARASGLSDSHVRRMLSDRNLLVAGVDCLFGWAGGETLPGDPAFNLDIDEMIGAAAVLGAPSINLAHAFGTSIDPVAAPERLAGICEEAIKAGISITLEPIPWGGIPTLEAGAALIRASGAANAKLAIDAWHFFRAGSRLEDIATIPPEMIGAVQFCDAKAVPAQDHWAETADRILPMEGELAVKGLAKTLRTIGFSGPFGIECPSAQWQHLDAATVGKRCGEAMRRLREAASA